VAEGVADSYDTLSPDNKKDSEKLIQVVQIEIAKIDTSTIDSASRQILRQTNSQIEKFGQQLTKSDSIGELYLKQANDLMGATAELGIPIGWSCDIAPLSWLKRGKKSKQENTEDSPASDTKKPENGNDSAAIDKTQHGKDTITMEEAYRAKMLERNRLLKYMNNRNNNIGSHWWYVLFWFVGIVITGIMLSFGATFWFDLLVKLVNIRRAGIKPLDKNKPQKS
jgi:hypothetical protein